MNNDEIDRIITKFLNNESIALDLIHFYGDSDFENELLHRADKAVSDSFGCTLTRERKALVAVALTFVALRYYDGNMWEHIRDLLPITYGIADSDAKADGKIRSILQLFKKDCNYSNPDSLIAVPLVASGVTHYWLSSFFDFCFAIYKENLLSRRDIDDSALETELHDTFEAMKSNNHLSEDEDIIKIAAKTYKLSRYTQSALLTGTNLDGIASIGTHCIRSIIKCLENETEENKPFYIDAFNEWKVNFFSDKTERNKIVDSGVWKIQIRYDNGKFVLITRTIKIDESNEPNKVRLLILNDNKIVDETDELEIDNAIGGYIVKSKRIVLECNILEKLSYQIVCEDKVLFDSEDKLFESVYLFDAKDGSQVKSGSDFDGVLIVVTKAEINTNALLYKGNGYCVSQVLVNPSGDYVFDGTHYAFKTIRKPGLDGVLCAGFTVKTKIDVNDFPLYRCVNAVLVETREEKENVSLIIDGKKYKEPDIVDYPVLENGFRQYKILIPTLSNGFHVVSVVSNSTGSPLPKSSFSFVLDSLAMKKIVMISEDLFRLRVNSSFVNDTKEVSIGTTEVDFLCSISGRGVGKLIVDPEVMAISLDGTKWLSDNSRIHFSKVPDPKLFLSGPKSMTVHAFGKNVSFDIPMLEVDGKEGMYQISISAVLALANENIPFIRLYCSCDEQRASFYIDFVTYVDLAKSTMNYDPIANRHDFMFWYESEKKLTCRVINVLTRAIAFETLISSGITFSPDNLRAFCSYKIILSEKGNGMFAKEKTIDEIPYFFVNSRDIINQVFRIVSVEYYDGQSSTTRNSAIKGNETTIKITNVNRDDPSTYVGTIRRVDVDYFNDYCFFKLLKISTDSEFEGNKIWIYVNDLDGDPLLFDTKNREIYRTNIVRNGSETMNMPGIERILVQANSKG